MVSGRSVTETVGGIGAGLLRNRRTPVKHRFLTFFIDPNASKLDAAASTLRIATLIAAGIAQIGELAATWVAAPIASKVQGDKTSTAAETRKAWQGAYSGTHQYLPKEDEDTVLKEVAAQPGTLTSAQLALDAATLYRCEVELADYTEPGHYKITPEDEEVVLSDLQATPWSGATPAQRAVLSDLASGCPTDENSPKEVTWGDDTITIADADVVKRAKADLEAASVSMPLPDPWALTLPATATPLSELPDDALKAALLSVPGIDADTTAFCDPSVIPVRITATNAGATRSFAEVKTALATDLRRSIGPSWTSLEAIAEVDALGAELLSSLEQMGDGSTLRALPDDAVQISASGEAEGEDDVVTLSPGEVEDLVAEQAALIEAIIGGPFSGLDADTQAVLARIGVVLMADQRVDSSTGEFVVSPLAKWIVGSTRTVTVPLAAALPTSGNPTLLEALLADTVNPAGSPDGTVELKDLCWSGDHFNDAEGRTALKSLRRVAGSSDDLRDADKLLWDDADLTTTGTATTTADIPGEVLVRNEIDLELHFAEMSDLDAIGNIALQAAGALAQEPMRWFGEFQSIDYQGPTTSTLPYRELGGTGPKYFLKETDCNNVTLKTGFINQRWLLNWITQVEWGKNFRRTGVIIMFDRSGLFPMRIIELKGCFPVAWTGTNLDAGDSGSQPIDTFELTCGDIVVTNLSL